MVGHDQASHDTRRIEIVHAIGLENAVKALHAMSIKDLNNGGVGFATMIFTIHRRAKRVLKGVSTVALTAIILDETRYVHARAIKIPGIFPGLYELTIFHII